MKKTILCLTIVSILVLSVAIFAGCNENSDECVVTFITENGGKEVRYEKAVKDAVAWCQDHIDGEFKVEIEKEYTSFSNYLKSFITTYHIYELNKTSSPLSDAISNDLKSRGMKFVGTTIIYSYLQATGIIVSHEENCFLAKK